MYKNMCRIMSVSRDILRQPTLAPCGSGSTLRLGQVEWQDLTDSWQLLSIRPWGFCLESITAMHSWGETHVCSALSWLINFKSNSR